MVKKTSAQTTSLFTAMLLLAFTIGFSACNDLNLNDTKGVGMMNLHLSNAAEASKGPDNGKGGPPDDRGPSDRSLEGLEEVNIDIQQLRILHIPSLIDTVATDTLAADSIIVEPGPEGHARWIDLPIDTTATNLNLLDLTGTDLLLASAELEEGFYSEIRLVLGDGNNVVVNGVMHPLKVPSGQQSGYKIKLGEPLHSDEVLDLTIEFDAEQSVKVTGNGKYILQPVLRVF